MTTFCIALLGRKDLPTDAVEEYCCYLSSALQAKEIQLEILRVPWEAGGWSDSLKELSRQAAKWSNTWVVIQYTALSWSARGFPSKVLGVLRILKSAGARVGMVFHDVEPYPGTRLIDSVRHFAQVHTMRHALAIADLAIFTVPPDQLSWLTNVPPHAVFIPVGPNLPIPISSEQSMRQKGVPTIGVFSITGGEAGAAETRTIIAAVRHAAQKLGKLRLSIFGRCAELREDDLRKGLRELPVELSVQGVLKPDQVVQELSACEVLLFVRGTISSRRSSAIAGIACGLPVIAYRGTETGIPITEAGVVLVSPDKPDEINSALVRVLSDSAYRTELAARSLEVYQTRFAWAEIAARWSELLKSV